MNKDTATYKIYLDEEEGMQHAFLTIDRRALDEIGCLDEMLDAELQRYDYLTSSKLAFKVDGTLRVTFADGTEKELGDKLTICFSDEHTPGIVVKHKGKSFMVCVDVDDIEECDDDDDSEDDDDESDDDSEDDDDESDDDESDDDESDDDSEADDDESDDDAEHDAEHDLGPSAGADMLCPMCGGEVRCKSVITKAGYAVYSTGCKACGLYGASAESGEKADGNFRQLREQLVQWKNKALQADKDAIRLSNLRLSSRF